MSRPTVSPFLAARARRVLRPPLAVDLAVAATGDEGPSLVVLVVDRRGLLIAVRELGLGADDIVEACSTFLRLARFQRRGAAVLVSVDPGFGVDPPAGAEQAWHEVRRNFEAHGLQLFDWLVAAGPTVVSVPRTFGEPAAW
jgi:hypothetical protein